MLVDQPAGRRAYRGRVSNRMVLVMLAESQIPPKPVAKPTVPSEASISTRNEPRTLMPQLVRDLRYCSHFEQGVEMSLSMSLRMENQPGVRERNAELLGATYQWPPLTLW